MVLCVGRQLSLPNGVYTLAGVPVLDVKGTVEAFKAMRESVRARGPVR